MMQKWEYLQEEDLLSEDLNRHGQEGWELVGVSVTLRGRDGYGATHCVLYTFKRPFAEASDGAIPAMHRQVVAW